jgi:hypothetical protein
MKRSEKSLTNHQKSFQTQITAQKYVHNAKAMLKPKFSSAEFVELIPSKFLCSYII